MQISSQLPKSCHCRQNNPGTIHDSSLVLVFCARSTPFLGPSQHTTAASAEQCHRRLCGCSGRAAPAGKHRQQSRTGAVSGSLESGFSHRTGKTRSELLSPSEHQTNTRSLFSSSNMHTATEASIYAPLLILCSDLNVISPFLAPLKDYSLSIFAYQGTLLSSHHIWLSEQHLPTVTQSKTTL